MQSKTTECNKPYSGLLYKAKGYKKYVDYQQETILITWQQYLHNLNKSKAKQLLLPLF